MDPIPTDHRDVLRAYWRAEEAREIDPILEFFLPDAVFVDRLGREVRGEDLRSFYAASVAAFPRASVEEERIVVDGPYAVAQYVAHLTAEDGGERQARVALVAELYEGRFRRLESYFDGSSIG